MPEVFADTFYWIALFNPNDPDHDRVVASWSIPAFVDHASNAQASGKVVAFSLFAHPCDRSQCLGFVEWATAKVMRHGMTFPLNPEGKGFLHSFFRTANSAVFDSVLHKKFLLRGEINIHALSLGEETVGFAIPGSYSHRQQDLGAFTRRLQ